MAGGLSSCVDTNLHSLEALGHKLSVASYDIGDLSSSVDTLHVAGSSSILHSESVRTSSSPMPYFGGSTPLSSVTSPQFLPEPVGRTNYSSNGSMPAAYLSSQHGADQQRVVGQPAGGSVDAQAGQQHSTGRQPQTLFIPEMDPPATRVEWTPIVPPQLTRPRITHVGANTTSSAPVQSSPARMIAQYRPPKRTTPPMRRVPVEHIDGDQNMCSGGHGTSSEHVNGRGFDGRPGRMTDSRHTDHSRAQGGNVPSPQGSLNRSTDEGSKNASDWDRCRLQQHSSKDGPDFLLTERLSSTATSSTLTNYHAT
jgi:hypothetical protein